MKAISQLIYSPKLEGSRGFHETFQPSLSIPDPESPNVHLLGLCSAAELHPCRDGWIRTNDLSPIDAQAFEMEMKAGFEPAITEVAALPL
jgi:hypothetical protein